MNDKIRDDKLTGQTEYKFQQISVVQIKNGIGINHIALRIAHYLAHLRMNKMC